MSMEGNSLLSNCLTEKSFNTVVGGDLMSEEKKRLSWREIDKLKDASGLAKLRRKRERESLSVRQSEDKRIKERYLKELEKLFTKDDSEREELLKKLHQSVGKKDFKKIALLFYEKFGLPEDARDLLPFFDLEEREILMKLLEKVRERFLQFNTFERQALISRMKTLQLSTRDEFLAYKCEKLLRELTP